MLREHYPADKLFEEMAVYFPNMDPILVGLWRNNRKGAVKEEASKD